mmetsp:Transcript_2740/g.4162  ORF Transcript_2740/g.4162 Transcript_2740/m.4162 type:complete len:121 (-) Transcript_2740:918-1280(-)
MVRRKRPHHLVVASVVVSIMSLSHATSNSLESDTTNNDHQRRTNLRQGELSHNFRTGAEQASPQLSDCLYSASSSEDCSKKEGCVWCKEPVYGLCLTKELAKKMSFLPFLTCSNQTLAII